MLFVSLSFNLIVFGDVSAAQLVANGTSETASGTYDTGTATGNPGYALHALNGGDITSSSPLTLITGGNLAYAAYAQGVGGGAHILIAAESSATTTGIDAKAISAQNGGQIKIESNVTITTSGTTADGLHAFLSGSTIDAQNISITTMGNQANGVNANSGGVVTLSGAKIATHGIFADGLYAAGPNNSTIVASDISVSVSGALSSAAEAMQGILKMMNASLVVEATAAGGRGISATNASTADLSDSTIIVNANSTIGSLGIGVAAGSNSSVTLNNVDITIGGTNNYGVQASSGGQLNINRGSIKTTGDNEIALYSLATATQTRALINATDVAITTTRDGAYGVLARNGSDVILTNSTLETHGQNAYALYSTLYNTSNPGSIRVEGGSVHAYNAAAIVSDTTTLETTLIDTTVTGKDAFLSVINGGTINLGSYNSTLNGSALLDSAMSATSNVSLFNNSQWNLSDNSEVTTLLNNQSTIHFTNDHYKSLAVTNYVGNQGIIELNTFLGDSSSPSDLLIINNNGSATGDTGLIINNTTGTGALTDGDGILVVQALGNRTTSSDAFSLARPVVAGPFEYYLYRSGLNNTNENNWYLRSICPLSNPLCSPEPPMDFRRETKIYPTLAATTLLYGQTLISTLHERVGQDRWGTDSLTNSSSQRVWGRIIGLHGDRDRITNRKANQKNVSYNYNFAGLQLGGDLIEYTTTKGSRNHIGGYGAFGNSDGDVKCLTHHIGSNEFAAYTLGGYWIYYSPTEAYIDTVLQATFYTDMNSRSYRGMSIETGGTGFGASVEGGYPLYWKQQWLLEPQGQLIYQSVNLDDTHDIGAKIHFRENDALAGRLGVRLANEQKFSDQQKVKKLVTWFRPNFWYQFKGNPQTQFSSSYGYMPFQSQLEGSSMEFNLGTTIEFPKNTFLYANGSYTTGLNLHLNAYNGQVGFKVKLV